MQNKILIATECVTLANHFVLCMFIFFVAQVLILGQPAAWYLQLIFPIYLGFAVAIRLLITNTFPIFIGLHLVLFGSLYFLPVNNLMFIEYLVYLVILTMQSISFWKRNGYPQNKSIPWPSFMMMVIFYIYSIVTEQTTLNSIIYILGTVYILLYLAKLYCTGLYDMANSKITVSKMPLTQIVKSNTALVGMILGIAVIAILLANAFNLDFTIYAIGNALLAILRFFMAAFRAIANWLESLMPTSGAKDTPTQTLGDLFANLAAEHTLFTIIMELLLQLIQIAIFGALLYFIFKGLYRSVKQFLLQNMGAGDIIEGLAPPTKENTSDRLDALLHSDTREPASKIRRRYKKAILKHKKDIALHQALTTNEIEQLLPTKEQAGMKQLKLDYEHIRYAEIKEEP